MTRISDMTPLTSLPATGAYVPVEKTGSTTNYRYDLSTLANLNVLFVNASSLIIPTDIFVISTTGYSTLDKGGANYVYDIAVDAAYVTAHPRASFISANGRGFRLSADQEWSIDQFGVIGKGNPADAANDFAALEAMKAYQSEHKETGLGYGSGGRLLRWGANRVHIGANTFDLSDVEINIICEQGRGAAEARSAILSTGTTAVRIQNADTTGATGTRSPTTSTGAGSSITGLVAIGDYSGTESEAHGFHLRGSVALYACGAYGFAGDGFFCQGDSEDPTRLGNVNMTLLQDCVAQACRNGFVPQGADANNVKFDSCQAIINRAWGFKNLSFLGAIHINCDASQNGLTAGAIPTMVAYSGNRYSARKNGTWSNAPSGTTAHTADWLYVSAGGVNAPLNINAWSNVATYRDGGSFRSDGGGNAANVYIFDYHESGQGLAQIDPPALVLGGQLARSLVGVAAIDHISSLGNDTLWVKGGLFIDKVLQATGTNHEFGPTSGAAADLAFNFHTTNFTCAFTATRWAAGVPTIMGSLQWFNGKYYLNATSGGFLRYNGSDIATILTGGVDLASGKVLSVNGTQVVGARGSAVADAAALTSVNATNAAAAPTQAEFNAFVAEFNKLRTDVDATRTTLNTGLARLRAATGHGLIS